MTSSQNRALPISLELVSRRRATTYPSTTSHAQKSTSAARLQTTRDDGPHYIACAEVNFSYPVVSLELVSRRRATTYPSTTSHAQESTSAARSTLDAQQAPYQLDFTLSPSSIFLVVKLQLGILPLQYKQESPELVSGQHSTTSSPTRLHPFPFIIVPYTLPVQSDCLTRRLPPFPRQAGTLGINTPHSIHTLRSACNNLLSPHQLDFTPSPSSLFTVRQVTSTLPATTLRLGRRATTSWLSSGSSNSFGFTHLAVPLRLQTKRLSITSFSPSRLSLLTRPAQSLISNCWLPSSHDNQLPRTAPAQSLTVGFRRRTTTSSPELLLQFPSDSKQTASCLPPSPHPDFHFSPGQLNLQLLASVVARQPAPQNCSCFPPIPNKLPLVYLLLPIRLSLLTRPAQSLTVGFRRRTTTGSPELLLVRQALSNLLPPLNRPGVVLNLSLLQASVVTRQPAPQIGSPAPEHRLLSSQRLPPDQLHIIPTPTARQPSVRSPPQLLQIILTLTVRQPLVRHLLSRLDSHQHHKSTHYPGTPITMMFTPESTPLRNPAPAGTPANTTVTQFLPPHAYQKPSQLSNHQTKSSIIPIGTHPATPAPDERPVEPPEGSQSVKEVQYMVESSKSTLGSITLPQIPPLNVSLK
ncbi:hypothetical protein PGT21_000199 [Puccinia graminis f. sp. tritici]|uniref:Uncharacterized protein n=1 Tax=Puccinia graminis f. sp. tritici TaxID=56615 RepID=A0A5B0LHJ7_PUCGR|nr:hypothetical protein PGT21_000199 [Puccinia graminis f. sp. tritici]